MSNSSQVNHPLQGVGLGLRSQHYPLILNELPPVPWFEVLADNYLVTGGPVLNNLDKICQHYPVVLHSVGMSLGSTDPLNWDYLTKIKRLADRVHAHWVSDHLCWVSCAKQYLHELLPLPYTEEALNHVVTRIKQVQDFLERPLLIENVSSYLSYKHQEMTEWEFINYCAEEADCLILLDINNIYVSSYNHNFNPEHYLQQINPRRVGQFHLAGYDEHPGYYLDAHGARVNSVVWDLYAQALQRFGAVPTLIEWDNNIPVFSELLAEANKAEHLMVQHICFNSELSDAT